MYAAATNMYKFNNLSIYEHYEYYQSVHSKYIEMTASVTKQFATTRCFTPLDSWLPVNLSLVFFFS